MCAHRDEFHREGVHQAESKSQWIWMGVCSAHPCGNASVRSEKSQLSVVKIPNQFGFLI